MTDFEQSDVLDDGRSQLDAIAELDIAQLRKAAKAMGIPSQRDWTKDDFVKVIKQKQESNALASFVFDDSQAPKPGYARVIIHRDNTPNHKNTPVHLGVNGRIIQVPRGGQYDIPIVFIDMLKNAVVTQLTQIADGSRDNPGGLYKDENQTSYPFQVVAMTPGPFVNTHDGRAATAKKKQAFADKYGRYPTDGEFKEAMKNQMAKDNF